MPYAAFISYKHTTSSAFAEELELHVKRFARSRLAPPLRLFRDEQHLRPGEPLGPAIRTALVESEHLILLASPEAAASVWVRDELRIWCDELGRRDRLMVVLTSGVIGLSDDGKKIDWTDTSALPRMLERYLHEAPLWLDARAVSHPGLQRLDHDPYFRIVAALSAALQGRAPNAVIGREWALRRRQLVTAWLVAGALLLLSLTNGAVALELREELAQARSRELAATSNLLTRGERLALAADAALASPTTEAVRALLQAHAASPSLVWEQRVSDEAVDGLAVYRGALVATTDDDTSVHLSAHGHLEASRTGVRAIATDDLGHVWSASDVIQARWHPAIEPDDLVQHVAGGTEWVAWSEASNAVLARRAWGGEVVDVARHDGQVTDVDAAAGWVASSALEMQTPVQVWSAQTGSRPLPDPPYSANDVAIHPDGSLLAAGFEDGTIGLWSLPGLELRALRRVPGSVSSSAWRPDGRALAVGTDSGLVVVFDGELDAVEDELDAVAGGVFALAWDDEMLLTGGSDGYLRAWRPREFPPPVQPTRAPPRRPSWAPAADPACVISETVHSESGRHSLALQRPASPTDPGSLPRCSPLVRDHRLGKVVRLPSAPAWSEAGAIDDTNVVVVAPADGYRSIQLLHWRPDGRLLSRDVIDTSPVSSVALSPDGAVFLGGLRGEITRVEHGQVVVESDLDRKSVV